jgi:phytoene dehydrogenase-like protein
VRDADVIIIGGGLTGLRAAIDLVGAGLSVLVFERAEQVGGRVSTEIVNGYKLDRGFQVVLSAYPELKTLRGVESLECRAFSSGARIRSHGRFQDFVDPRRHPEALISTLRSPLASFSDLVRLFFLSRGGRRATCSSLGISTDEGLARGGFSQRFQDSFLKPFLRGVLLDPHLQADFGVSRFYLQMFAYGDALLPLSGAQGLSNLLSENIGSSHVRLRSTVNSLSKNEVALEDGESFSARKVLCATDALGAAQLGSSEQTFAHHGCATLYFSCSSPPFEEPIIVLSGEPGPIATLAVVTNVQPTHAPPGRHLVAVSVIGPDAALPKTTLYQRVLTQARQWYGDQVQDWAPVKSFSIPAAVVARPRLSEGVLQLNGVMYAGDYLSYPSQNGALSAGRCAAAKIIEELLG